jgi:hypothetical protein
MKYVVYEEECVGHNGLYDRPLEKGALAPHPRIHVGKHPEMLACEKARALHEKTGRLALAA